MIQAVVFDFDGTVFDSESHAYETVREIFAEHGAELPREVWGRCVGRAGMRVVLVPDAVTANLEFGEADLRLASLAEIPLHDLIERLAREP